MAVEAAASAPGPGPMAAPAGRLLATLRQVLAKVTEGLPAWDELQASGEAEAFLAEVFHLEPSQMSIKDNLHYLVFVIHVFQSLENSLVRNHALKLVHLALWSNLSPKRLQLELLSNAELATTWKKLRKAMDKKGPEYMLHQRTFLPKLVEYFLDLLRTIHAGSAERDAVVYCERFVEFMTDLLCQLPTRRFFRAYLEDRRVHAECLLAPLYAMPEGKLFKDLLGILQFYTGFEIDDFSGAALDNNQIKQIHTRKLIAFQRVAFKYFPDALRPLALCNLGLLETRKLLRPHLTRLPALLLHRLCDQLALLPPAEGLPSDARREFYLEVLLERHERRQSQLDELNALPLYPSEKLLWDFNMVPEMVYQFEAPLALPKLNLQFLTFHDYLLRNFNLFRLESTYEIRQDVEDAIIRLDPRKDAEGKVFYRGLFKSRMACPVEDFQIKYVGPADIGQIKPHDVRGLITVDLALLKEVPQREWSELRQHDVVFLLTLDPPTEAVNPVTGAIDVMHYDRSKPFLEQFRVKYVRGAEVIDVRDDRDNVFTGMGDSGVRLVGTKRFIKVHLDTAQYHADVMQNVDCYSGFHLLLRRKPKENNFKAVLHSIRELMNTQCVVPEWMHDVFLGYGDPDSAHYRNMPNQIRTVNFVDSLLDLAHVREVFGPDVALDPARRPEELQRPFLVTFPVSRPAEEEDEDEGPEKPTPSSPGGLLVSAYLPPNPGPYPQDKPRLNDVRFTPVQVEALRAGANPGLTMVVGPPGTGKTDVAVQMISNIYKNFPNERTLIVTHSNQAINDIFAKVTRKDVDERHLLRLGGGVKDLQEELEVEKDFSKHGRVNFMLERRLVQLQQVRRIADSLDIGDSLGDVDYTCETAAHFYRHEILARWERFLQQKDKLPEVTMEFIRDEFPFHKTFHDLPDLFDWSRPVEDLWYTVEGCWSHIQRIFEELEDCRAFELFKGSYDRGNYLLCRQAKIIAMTCTFAALKRTELVRLKFEYDNILMEEAAQILEIETFIPMLLQNPDPQGGCRLKRIILIGDHNQLPPVVKNMAFQKYSHMDQSLFTRFVRLGVPTIQLNAQGRMRTSLADLYRWRYKDLGDLPHVQTDPAFHVANAGFTYEYQCVDVPDYNGHGETEPQPHFFQNLGEAEYVVAVYMYMRLLGYPAEKISILTTYNGQKFLIRDVLNHRCGENTVFGLPAKVTTVDKFQGRQNDYVLLSLVRTRNIGHLRDVRRLVVAMSRARLGLYVFCRVAHFKDVFELKPAFNLLTARPTVLSLHLKELRCPTTRLVTDLGEPFPMEQGLEQLGQLVDQMTKMRVKLETLKYQQQYEMWQRHSEAEQKRAEEEARAQEELQRQHYVQKRVRELQARQRAQGQEFDEDEEGEGAPGDSAEPALDEGAALKKARTDF
nr:RNA helicase aquarius [Euglena gracilis]